MSTEGIYVECITCGTARLTDNRPSVGDFRRIHRDVTGHTDFYEGPMPDARARRVLHLHQAITDSLDDEGWAGS